MKFSLIIFSVCFSAGVYSQNVLFSFETKNITMRELFNEIEQQSQFRFFYNDVLINIDKKININVSDKTIDELLDMVLSNSGISYRILDNNLIVVSPAVLLQQGINVTGTVTDVGNIPIHGATVSVKGASLGAVTDDNGRYTINVPNQDSVIVFSIIGYATQEFVTGNQTIINVTLVEDLQKNDEDDLQIPDTPELNVNSEETTAPTD